VHELLISEARAQLDFLLPAFHQWLGEDKSVWCSFFRIENDYLLRFTGLADFKIASQNSTIDCWPALNVAEADIRQLYLNQVLPLAQSHSGKLVFHASAVEVDQNAIVFIGTSGRGKSTLAASFSTQQYRFLTDDGLLLEKTSTGYQVMPSHASIRLWEDSQAAILGEQAAYEAPLHPCRQKNAALRTAPLLASVLFSRRRRHRQDRIHTAKRAASKYRIDKTFLSAGC
jgi:hypothetical protein